MVYLLQLQNVTMKCCLSNEKYPSKGTEMFSPKRKQHLEFLTIQYLTLKRLGIDIDTIKGKSLIKDYGKFLSLISCIVYLKIGLINFAVHSGFTNVDEISRSFYIFNQSCLIVIKLTIFLVKGDKFLKLISDINSLAEKANARERRAWLCENLRSQKIGKLYMYACLAGMIVSMSFHLIFMIYDYKQNQRLNLTLPYGGKFPFYKDGLFLFTINYILSSIYMYCLINLTVGIDTLYGWYIYSISAHFRILRSKVESIGSKLQSGVHINFNHEIGLLVDYHNRTLAFVDGLNNVFGGILWTEVMLNCLQICFTLYTLQNEDNLFNMPLDFMALVAIIIQLIIYCFGGEKIKNESLMLSLDFYISFPWHLMSCKEKKLLLFSLMRSQRLSGLRGVFFEVDRKLLVYILKTAFSFNTLLTTMKE